MLTRLFITMLMTTSAALAGDRAYLFATFDGEATPMTEQIYFVVSKDGKTWEALNGRKPVLVSDLGEKGVRDPFVVRSHDGKKFFLLATDLSINLTKHDWGRAVTRGSRSIVIWESTDLVTWSAPRLVPVAAEDAGCTWAPEAVYDEEQGDYLVFWASKTKRDDFAKHRIWASRTKDFVTFSPPFIYIDHKNDVIDTDIVHENGTYYRFSKDERHKAVTMEASDKLSGPWKNVAGFSLAKLTGYEGPQCFELEPRTDAKPATWCLLLDFYSKGQGYQAFVTNDLAKGDFRPAEGFRFPFRLRHGSVLPITTEEYDRLVAAYPKSGPKE